MKNEDIDKNGWAEFLDKLAVSSRLGLTVEEFKRKSKEIEINKLLKGKEDASKRR